MTGSEVVKTARVGPYSVLSNLWKNIDGEASIDYWAITIWWPHSGFSLGTALGSFYSYLTPPWIFHWHNSTFLRSRTFLCLPWIQKYFYESCGMCKAFASFASCPVLRSKAWLVIKESQDWYFIILKHYLAVRKHWIRTLAFICLSHGQEELIMIVGL